MEDSSKPKICIVGGGAAGLAAAWRPGANQAVPGLCIRSIGPGDCSRNNKRATPFIRKMKTEIEKFKSVLAMVKRWPIAFLFVSIETLLRRYGFSDDFRHHVVYPLPSLFFASGVDSMHSPAAVVAEIF